MFTQIIFVLAQFGRFVAPIALAVVLLRLAKPRRFFLRYLWAVFVAWLFNLFYVIYVYNPAGIAYGHALGEHFPENRFDNNTTAVALMAGWVYPSIAGLLFCVWRKKC
jgi:hypothetical protein